MIYRSERPALPDDVVLAVRGVSKKFCMHLRRSMKYGIKDLMMNLAGIRQDTTKLRRDEFMALEDVDFELRKGVALGVIGDNGSGKTTLLRLIGGIFPPDKGEIAVRGRVGALIALGAGFHPLMTGRENVYINGSILGMMRDEIDEKFDEIVAFAEIGEFLEAPVSTYSSGMRVRLGFSIAVHTNPDLLLVDEILAVGDMSFNERCMRKMDEIRSSDKSIVLVTHSLFRIEAFCDKAIWLDHGRVVLYGDACEVVRSYLDTQEKREMATKNREGMLDMERAAGGSAGGATKYRNIIDIKEVELLDDDGVVRDEFPFSSAVTVRMHYFANRRVDEPLFNLRIMHRGRGVAEVGMLIDGSGPTWIEGEGFVECRLDEWPLTPKVYDLLIFVRSGNGVSDMTAMRIHATFRITDEGSDRIPLRGPMALNHFRGSLVYVPRTWRFIKNGRETDTVRSDYLE